jgi:hypothetical protein
MQFLVPLAVRIREPAANDFIASAEANEDGY